jgi:MFS transporter, putative metabolite:H+ symporter
MLQLLEQQQKLTRNQWLIAGAATLGDMLDFFDFFLISFVLGFVVKNWHLTFGESGAVLLASGITAPFGSLFYGWLADKVGRRTALVLSVLNVSLATGAMALTPTGAWMYLVVCRLFVGFGVTGLYSVDITLMQEFSPSHKRGWFTGLTTTMLPAGSLLAALLGYYAEPYIGWRGMVTVGLLPAFLCLYIRAFVPESPLWLLRKGRLEEARKSLAWALMIDPATITLPTSLPEVEKTRWIELFKYPRSIVAGCLTGLTQTGGVALALWQITLFVMVLGITAGEASKLAIFVSISAILGRFFCSWISDAMGRRPSGVISCVVSALLMFLAGYLHSVTIGGVSMFFLFILLQSFLGSGNYSIVGPYMGEMWPSRLRGSGMGLVYGVGNLGKFIGPLGLALIAGSDNFVKPEATMDALVPGFAYFAYWYLIGAFAFWFIGTETRARTIDDIDAEMAAMNARAPQIITAVAGIVAGCVAVGVQPFMPIPVFIGVGMAVIAPAVGGIILLGSAIFIIAVFGLTLSGLTGILGVSTVILSLVAGISALVSAFSQPAAEPLPAVRVGADD